MYEHFFFLGDLLYDWGGYLDCGYKRDRKWGWFLNGSKFIKEVQDDQATQEIQET